MQCENVYSYLRYVLLIDMQAGKMNLPVLSILFIGFAKSDLQMYSKALASFVARCRSPDARGPREGSGDLSSARAGPPPRLWKAGRCLSSGWLWEPRMRFASAWRHRSRAAQNFGGLDEILPS